MLFRIGFGLKWKKWTKSCITTTSFVILINGGHSSFFNASIGLRQGNPLSPLLFIVVMKALNELLGRAKELQLMRGVAVGSMENITDVSHLFFADDTLIFVNQN